MTVISHDPDAVPPCPACGAALDVTWIDVHDLAAPIPNLIPGQVRCSTRPHHDVTEAVRLLGTVAIARHGQLDTTSCPLYLLDRWRADGWFPTDLEYQTPDEAVEHRVWQL